MRGSFDAPRTHKGVMTHRLRTTDTDSGVHFSYVQGLLVFLDSESKLKSIGKENIAFTIALESVSNQGPRLNNCKMRGAPK